MSRAKPTILAFDCSAAACSAALWRDGAIVAQRFVEMERGQAERLMPMIDAVMGEAGVHYGVLDVVAVTVGPGSFTGIRIGLAAARGLALAAGVKLLAVTSFAAIAETLPRAEVGLAVAIDDRRGGLYWQEFAGVGGLPLSQPVALAASGLADRLRAMLRPGMLVAGDGTGTVRRLLGEGAGITFGPERPPDAAAIAGLAAERADDLLADRFAGLPPVPLYLRPPEARLPGSGTDGP